MNMMGKKPPNLYLFQIVLWQYVLLFKLKVALMSDDLSVFVNLICKIIRVRKREMSLHVDGLVLL